MDRDTTKSQAKAEEHVWGECPFCGLRTAYPGDFCSIECAEEMVLEREADEARSRAKDEV